MSSLEEQRKAAEASQAKSHKWNVINTILAGVAIFLSVMMSDISSKNSAMSSMSALVADDGLGRTSICLDWASFVEEQQSSEKWDPNLTQHEIDERIDRMGVVLYSRTHEIVTYYNDSLKWLKEKSGDEPNLAPEGTELKPVGLAPYCGSASEFRQARDSNAELTITAHRP